MSRPDTCPLVALFQSRQGESRGSRAHRAGSDYAFYIRATADLGAFMRTWATPERAYTYARDVIKDRVPELEDLIMRSPKYAALYAIHVIKGRWPEAEDVIQRDAQAHEDYLFMLQVNTTTPRRPEGYDSLKTDPRLIFHPSPNPGDRDEATPAVEPPAPAPTPSPVQSTYRSTVVSHAIQFTGTNVIDVLEFCSAHGRFTRPIHVSQEQHGVCVLSFPAKGNNIQVRPTDWLVCDSTLRKVAHDDFLRDFTPSC